MIDKDIETGLQDVRDKLIEKELIPAAAARKLYQTANVINLSFPNRITPTVVVRLAYYWKHAIQFASEAMGAEAEKVTAEVIIADGLNAIVFPLFSEEELLEVKKLVARVLYFKE